MARYAIDNGVMNASRYFTKTYRKNVSESSIRNLKKEFLRMKKSGENEPTELEKKHKGAPLMLGKYDQDVIKYCEAVRQAGGVMNRHMLIGCAKGILKCKNRQLLTEFGGSANLTKTWAKSLFRRIGCTKRKGTKAERKIPEDFDTFEMEYLSEITHLVNKYDIPSELIINFDQTNVYIVPAGEYTMEKEGTKQVQIIGLDDKRQVTAVLACTMSGEFLPLQVIYQGKTDMCHAKFKFPNDWNITHTDKHWSKDESMLEYADQVIIPYVESVREKLPLSRSDQRVLCVFDVFKAHCCDSFKQKLYDANILIRYVPASCTGELQPLDASGNDEFKGGVEEKFKDCYAEQIYKGLEEGLEINEIKVDLKLSTLKPLHAGWMVSAFQATRKETFIKGWEKTGILDAVEKSKN